MIYWVRESTVFSFTYRLPIRFLNEELVKFNLRMQVKDKELREKLTPTFDLGCKRVLLSDDWYSALQQPNVKLVTNRIREINSNSIITHDGDEHPVDIIIWSTGFQVQKFPIPIYGVNGRSLAEQWSETMQVSIFVLKKRCIKLCCRLISGISRCNYSKFPKLVFSSWSKHRSWSQFSGSND
jgi:cation diffusion facilitator CzcD-associated flavoprotein CzcO